MALQHDRADGDVGHETAVHHVDMDPIGPGRVDGADLLAQAREIGRQDRGRDEDGAGHGQAFMIRTAGVRAATHGF